jgi:hypothetical protein
MLTILIIGAWFAKRWQPPRIVIFCAVFVGALVVNSIGDIRYNAEKSGSQSNALLSVDYWDNMERLQAFELRNAAMFMWVVDETSSFDFGASIWNAFVGEYVPGQFVGYETKQSLLMGSQAQLLARELFGYSGADTGATPTGFSDSFQMFWYFGFIIFLMISVYMKQLFIGASSGHLSSQVMYVTCVSSALQSITHYSTYVITFVPLVAAMVWLVQILGATSVQWGPRRKIAGT